jgi:hypothetical protein
VAGTKAGKGKRGEQDGWLERQNRALRDRGYKVSLDLHQGMVRLRATLPPKPSEPAGTDWKQRRISTGLRYPDQASEAVTQAEKLGAAIEKDTRTQQPFDWSPWERPSRGSKRTPVGTKPVISGVDAFRQTELWWVQQRKRSVSCTHHLGCGLRQTLASSAGQIPDLQPEHLIHLVSATELGSKTRRVAVEPPQLSPRCWGFQPTSSNRSESLGKGYSPTTDTAPRNRAKSDEELVALIDLLPSDWQWPVGICAVYGARPHEALLYAEVLTASCLAISAGKTGPRKSWPCLVSGLALGPDDQALASHRLRTQSQGCWCCDEPSSAEHERHVSAV